MPEKIEDEFGAMARKPVIDFQKGLQRASKYNDPTYLGFLLLFDYTTPQEQSYNGGSPLLAGSPGPAPTGEASGWETKPGTALDYLKRCGEYQRMHYLNAFITTLSVVNKKMPWYWQEMEGLDNAWKYKHFEDPYIGGDEAMIKINCLESIDLIITHLMDLYKKAVYDFDNRRIIIPENLRKFQVTVYVEEIRKFQIDKAFLAKLGGGLPPVPGAEGLANTGLGGKFADAKSDLNKSIGDKGDKVNDFFGMEGAEDMKYINGAGAKVIFALEYCEFDTDESSGPFGTLNMHAQEMAAQTIAFKYENLKKFSSYPMLEADLINDASESHVKGEWKNKLKEKGKQIAANAVNKAADFVKGKIAGLILGNVHGFSAGDIAGALQQGSIQGISSEIGQAASRFKKDAPPLTGRNKVFAEDNTSSNILSGEGNVNSSSQPSSNKPLSGDDNVNPPGIQSLGQSKN
jgi:hypothetical protein